MPPLVLYHHGLGGRFGALAVDSGTQLRNSASLPDDVPHAVHRDIRPARPRWSSGPRCHRSVPQIPIADPSASIVHDRHSIAESFGGSISLEDPVVSVRRCRKWVSAIDFPEARTRR